MENLLSLRLSSLNQQFGADPSFGGLRLKSKNLLADSGPHSTILALSSSKNWWLQ
jgi:hypothetical protein